ncbi:LL-diaminopimelate aminotransferase, chloroplastic [Hordeum vulgare]|nr:LL-diaminopimelate aminotransferase, chloroplastic [Hordeum vulgare]
MEEEINVFCIMTKAMKEVATVIRECKPLDVHPDLYGDVMTQGGFGYEALMAALNHLLDNKAEGVWQQNKLTPTGCEKHGGNRVDSDKVGGVKVEGVTADRQLGLKLKNFIIFVQFIVIVVL